MSDWILFAALSGVTGLAIGSFLNVVVSRGPVMWGLSERPAHVGADQPYNLATPRSHCPECGTRISWARLVPVVSWLLQRGKCAACGAGISARYPLVEIAGAVAAFSAFYVYGLSVDAAFLFVFLAFSIAGAAIDIERGYLPDAITLPLIWIGLLANLYGRFTPLPDAVVGAAAGYLVFRMLGEGYRLLRGAEGLGGGDTKFFAAIGAWFGWAALPVTAFIAAVLGLLAVAAMAMLKRPVTGQTAMPFGPALAAAAAAWALYAASGIDAYALLQP